MHFYIKNYFTATFFLNSGDTNTIQISVSEQDECANIIQWECGDRTS